MLNSFVVPLLLDVGTESRVTKKDKDNHLCLMVTKFDPMKHNYHHIYLPNISKTRGIWSLYSLHFLTPCIVDVTNFIVLSTVWSVNSVSPLPLGWLKSF